MCKYADDLLQLCPQHTDTALEEEYIHISYTALEEEYIHISYTALEEEYIHISYTLNQ